MLAVLLTTTFLMGIAGSPHCAAMCGPLCRMACGVRGREAGAGRAPPMPPWAGFQAGRIVGYAALGAIAAASVQAAGWLAGHTALLRPVWTLAQAAALAVGLMLLVLGREPVMLIAWTRGASRMLAGLRPRGPGPDGGMARPAWRTAFTRFGLGAAWGLMPCGLLYSAVWVAALGGSPLEGALAMAVFALGGAVSLSAFSWGVLRVARGASGLRLAGFALAASSAWALAREVAPAWCA